MQNSPKVLDALRRVVETPSLANARGLEQALRQSGFSSRLFGRLNQKSSIDAAAESDRGVTERIANAFDASLTAARRLAGVQSDPALRPRAAAQRFLSPDIENSLWEPQSPDITFFRKKSDDATWTFLILDLV